jgi:2Fe-2S ferredoxin
MKAPIHFVVVENNFEHHIKTYDGEYRNLMLLLNDKIFLDSFGECGGVGRCETCIIKIKCLVGNSTRQERNEFNTLSKMGYIDEDIRLACQLMVNKDLNNVVIEFKNLS